MILDTIIHALGNILIHGVKAVTTIMKWIWGHMWNIIRTGAKYMAKINDWIGRHKNDLMRALQKFRENILKFAEDLKTKAIDKIDQWTKPVQAYLPGLMWWVNEQFDTCEAWLRQRVYDLTRPGEIIALTIQQYMSQIQQATSSWANVAHTMLNVYTTAASLRLVSPVPEIEATFSTRRNVLQELANRPEVDRDSAIASLFMDDTKTRDIHLLANLGPDGLTEDIYTEFNRSPLKEMIDNSAQIVGGALLCRVRKIEDPDIKKEAEDLIKDITHGFCSTILQFNFWVLVTIGSLLGGVLKLAGYEFDFKKFREEMNDLWNEVFGQPFEDYYEMSDDTKNTIDNIVKNAVIIDDPYTRNRYIQDNVRANMPRA